MEKRQARSIYGHGRGLYNRNKSQRLDALRDPSRAVSGPPVPKQFVADILSNLDVALSAINVESADFKGTLRQINRDARSLADFVRAEQPLPVMSHNALRRLAGFVASAASRKRPTGPEEGPLEPQEVFPPTPAGLIIDVLAALPIDLRQITIRHEKYGRRLRALSARVWSLHDFRSGLAKPWSYNALWRLVNQVRADVTFVGPPVPPLFAAEILSCVDLSLSAININVHRFKGTLQYINRRAVSAEDFVRSKDPLSVGSYNALRSLANRVGKVVQRSRAKAHAALPSPPPPALPPVPKDFVAEIFAGLPVAPTSITISHEKYGAAVRGLSPTVWSLGDFIGGAAEPWSYNGLRRLINRIRRDATSIPMTVPPDSRPKDSLRVANPSVILEEVRTRLNEGGYTGLYSGRGCVCSVDDVAACGKRNRKNGEVYINGCMPGYVHRDPLGTGIWTTLGTREAPNARQWEKLRNPW